MTFTISGSGSVVSARLADSSGYAILDQAAVGMVHSAAPFPPIPAELSEHTLTVTVPVRFDLQ